MKRSELDELLDWFRSQLKDLTAERQVLNRLWGHAKPHLETSEHDEWKAWVEWCCEEARSPRAMNPVGLLTMRLRETAPEDAPEAPPERVVGQCEWTDVDRAAARTERVDGPPSRPPLAFVLPLSKCLGSVADAVKFITDEWERQGKPSVQDFDASELGVTA